MIWVWVRIPQVLVLGSMLGTFFDPQPFRASSPGGLVELATAKIL